MGMGHPRERNPAGPPGVFSQILVPFFKRTREDIQAGGVQIEHLCHLPLASPASIPPVSYPPDPRLPATHSRDQPSQQPCPYEGPLPRDSWAPVPFRESQRPMRLPAPPPPVFRGGNVGNGAGVWDPGSSCHPGSSTHSSPHERPAWGLRFHPEAPGQAEDDAGQGLSAWRVREHHLEGPFTQVAGSHSPRVPASWRLPWSPRICTSSKFQPLLPALEGRGRESLVAPEGAEGGILF